MAQETMTPRVLLDSCAWLAFLGRPAGGTGEILRLARRGDAAIITSGPIRDEVSRNLRKVKRTTGDLAAVLREIPTEEVFLSEADLERVPEEVEPKDRHVIAATTVGKVSFLVTFDRQHLGNPIVQALVPFRIGDALACLEWLRRMASPSDRLLPPPRDHSKEGSR